ncbi:MAG: T9SS type A sorting domain-containing protein [Bacteroidales bacterium]|nr:T9SS type A sorting domain-containing protein [Bacteroidales bacterium]
MKKIFYTLSILLIFITISSFNSLKAQEALSDENAISLNIFPNPAASGQEIKIELEVKDSQLVSYYIFDFAGKIVKESTQNRKMIADQILQLDLDITTKGLYFVQVIIEDKFTSTKRSKVKKLYIK